jgi:ubiquinone/menaquinone biosynthesis methyltransferase
MSQDKLNHTEACEDSQAEQTYFGYRAVTPTEKTSLVASVFTRVANRYDLMNDLMSGGIHRLWKNELIHMVRPRPGMHLLDMAGGTGDIAFRFLEASKDFSVQVTVCDYNADMLAEGRKRAINQGIIEEIEWITADASAPPFADNSFDAYTISFGLRNVTDIAAALKEAYRILKPGGQFLCLEFSKVTSPILAKLYESYSFHVIPRLGQIVVNDKESYQYLVESITQFPDQETLREMIEQAGFQSVSYRNMTYGVVAIHAGLKL